MLVSCVSCTLSDTAVSKVTNYDPSRTGMKCLPANKMSQANGVILHDWHAEILALRAFNHFVLEECRAVALGKRPSEYIRPRSDKELEEAEAAEVQGLGWNRQPYAWRDDVSLYMYCSESPCKYNIKGRHSEYFR